MIVIPTLQNIINNKCRVHRCNFSCNRRKAIFLIILLNTNPVVNSDTNNSVYI